MRKVLDKKLIREIEELFIQAKINAGTHGETAKKLVAEARKKAKRANLSLKKYRRLFCHNCNSYFIPGKNCIFRISKGKKTIKCLECLNYMRIKL
ncbi:MAG: hypothetical protein ACPLXC_02915 [Candidatus Pacearchaeota archaeon]